MLQNLEPRVLLSASLSSSKVLTVTGTNADNQIELKIVDNQLILREGGRQTGAFTGVKSIVVNALDGRDRVTVDANVTVVARIDGGNQSDTLTGGSGGDVLLGQGGHDFMVGGAGIDALIGGSGNDTLDGGTGDDYLDGQSGLNTVTYAARSAGVTIQYGYYEDQDTGDRYRVGSGGASGESDTYRSIDTFIGTNYADLLTAAANGVFFSDGTNAPMFEMFGGAGNDKLVSQGDWNASDEFDPTLHGGEGIDTITFSAESGVILLGDGGDDRLFVPSESGDESAGEVDGGPGIDTQYVTGTPTTPSQYTFGAAPGFENINLSQVLNFTGNELDNRIYVSGGSDVNWLYIHGGPGNDRIDLINGSRAFIFGDEGNDVIYGSTQADNIDGGTGDDAMFGFSGNDTINGGDGNDYMEGGAGDDSLVGGIGDDIFRGNAGVDRFEGNDGNDFFYSRDGEKDYLYGGPGADTADRDATEAVIDSV